jgi:hypothetical protein
MTTPHQIKLTALDGSNLLAFLGALGTLRTLSRGEAGILLSWQIEKATGIWQPELSRCPVARDDLAALLHKCLSPQNLPSKEQISWQIASKKTFKDAEKAFKQENEKILQNMKDREGRIKQQLDPKSASNSGKSKKELKIALKSALDELAKQTEACIEKERELFRLDELEKEWRSFIEANSPFPHFSMGEDFKVAPSVFRAFVRNGLNASKDSTLVPDLLEFAAAFATECILDQNGNIIDSDLRAVGGGQTRILKEIRKIVEETSAAHIEKSLFCAWDYSDPSPAMRWDPNENRPYALRANDPASDQKQVTMRGANRLAIEALPLLPVMTSKGCASTTGFRRTPQGIEISWPIWTDPLGMDEIRSLLSLPDFSNEKPNLSAICSRGIHQIYRSRRFGKEYRNFSPSGGLL